MSEEAEDLGIVPEKVCYVIVAARELDNKLEDEDAEETVHAPRLVEEGDAATEEFGHDSVYQELKSFIDGLNEEEQVSLVALMWLGRGEYAREEWDDAREEAARVRNAHTADYLMDTPLLADYLEEGLDQFGVSCDDIDPGRL